MQDQKHPLYALDRGHIDRMLSKELPSSEDLIDLARLLNRYEGFSGVKDLQMDLVKILKLWGLTREELNLQTQEIWANGYRPGQKIEEGLGSGFDTSEDSGT